MLRRGGIGAHAAAAVEDCAAPMRAAGTHGKAITLLPCVTLLPRCRTVQRRGGQLLEAAAGGCKGAALGYSSGVESSCQDRVGA